MATYFRKDGWVKSAVGPAVPGAQVFVCEQPANVPLSLTSSVPTPTPLASLFSDPNGLVPITQPIITDGFGHYNYYTLPGVYTEVIYLSSVLQQTYPDQSVGGLGTGPNNTGLTAGSNITIVGSTISATVPSGVQLQTNGVDNASQSKLNLTSSDGTVEFTDLGAGAVSAVVDFSAATVGLGSLHGWYVNNVGVTLGFLGENATFIGGAAKTIQVSATEAPFLRMPSQGISNGQGTAYGNVGTATQVSATRGPLSYWVARAAQQIGVAHNWWIGFTDRSPASVLMGTDPKTNNNICFYASNSGNFKGYCSDGVNSTFLDTGVAADGAFHTFKMTFSAGTVRFWIDGISRGTITTTLPTTTAPLWPVTTMEANAQNNDLGYMWWEFVN